jgi:hypothetical protein
MQPASLRLNDNGALECGVRVSATDPDLEDFEVDDDRVQRVLDLVGEIVGEAAHEVETVRPELLFVDRRQL